jgi:hypothetical protein
MDLLPNEVFALECIARYAREGLVVDSSNGQFAHCPYPKPEGQKKRLPGDEGYWLTFNDHQHQGLLQSKDVGRRCYIPYMVRRYFDTWPPGCFDLWDIYDEYNKKTLEWREAQSERMSGEKSPHYGKTGALHHNSKAIIAIQPDGTELHFGSGREAARELGISNNHLSSRYLKTGKSPARGKFKGWQFIYAT